MIRAVIFAICLACSGLALNAQDQQGQKPDKPYTKPLQQSPPQKPGKQLVDLQGCVAAGPQANTFVLAAVTTNPLSSGISEDMSGAVPSPTYQLYGHVSELQGLVGHRVEVKGVTNKKPEETATVGKEHKTTTAGPRAKGTGGGKETTPKVQTNAETKVELRRLDVQSVRAVEGACR